MMDSGKYIHSNLLWVGTFVAALISSIIFTWVYWQDSDSFNISSSPSPAPRVSAESISPIPLVMPGLDTGKVALGKRLFHETRLSGNNTLSCATCHPLDQGGTDNAMHVVAIDSDAGLINTPTVFNVGFNFRQFWNGRAADLEDQINDPLTHPFEMGSDWGQVVSRLNDDPSLKAAFLAIYSDGITPDNVRNAIATFERSLLTPNSRFDKFLRGDKNAINPDELAGYKLFNSYGCINCHNGVNIGGNMYEKLGIMSDYFSAENAKSKLADMGRYAITHIPETLHEFKVPGLRNVAVTAPYFHDGSAATLDKAVAIMGTYQLGVDLPKQDIARISAFLKTLTGEYNGRPL